MPSILIVDSDEPFLEELKSEASLVRGVVTSSSGQKSLEILKDSSLNLSGIFISASFASKDLYLVFESWIAHRYGTPLYILHDTQECPIPLDEMVKMGIQAAFKKPISYSQIIEIIEQYELQSKKPDNQKSSDPALSEEIHEDSGFHAIKAGIFMAGHRSDFDIYMKVGSGNYIKVIHLGDTLDRERLDKYTGRGVVDFYIKKEAQIKYLERCNSILSKILPHARVPFEVKAAQVFNYGEQAIALVKNYGLNAESIAYCKDSIERIQNLIRSVDKVDSPKIREFFSDALIFEHGVATAVFAGLIGRTAPFYIDRKADVVLLAALLHDIGLSSLPSEIQHEDEEKMTREQLSLYKTHPILGAETLAEVRSIPEIVVQAVRQHHERRTGKGFPSQNLKGQANVIAEVVGLGDEFLRFLKATGDKRSEHGNKVALHEILKGFSPAVVDAFQSVFSQ